MPLQNTFTLDVDFKKSNYINEPVVTQNDEVTFVLNVYDDGTEFDLSGVSTSTLVSERPDKQSVMTLGTETGVNQLTFALGSTEISVVGKINAVIQLYDVDGRVSTLPFTYQVLKDPATNYVPSTDEQTLIELVLGQGPAILAAAEQATVDANAATQSVEQIKNDTIAVKDATEQVRTDTLAVKNATKIIIEETIAVKDATETVKDETETAKQATVQATTNAIDATNTINLVLPNVLNLEYIAPYNATTQYEKNNIVRHGKNSYIALQPTLGNEPTGTTDSPFWGVLAIGGVDGLGSVVSVNGVGPNANGDVILTIPDPDLSGLATKNELNEKVDKLPGKDLSTNDYDDIEKTEVSKIKTKADVSYVDTKVASVVSGSPKGTYATLAALQTAFPTGNPNIYVVIADGKWYYWNGTLWIAGGVYQSTSIPDKSITLSKIDDSLSRRIKSVEVLDADPINLWNGRMWLLSVPTIYFHEPFTQANGTQWDSLKWRPTVNNINASQLAPSSIIDVTDNKGSIKIASNSDTETVAMQKVSQEKIVKTNEYRVLEFEISDYFEENTTIGGLTFGICPTIPSTSQYFFDEANWIRMVIGYEAAGRFILVQNKVSGNVSTNNYKETIQSNTGLRKYRFVFFNQSHFTFERFNGLDWITLYENLNAGLTFNEAYVVIERSTYGSTAIRTSNIDNIIVKD